MPHFCNQSAPSFEYNLFPGDLICPNTKLISEESLAVKIESNKSYFNLWELTYFFFLILFEGFGRARIWDLCQAHTPCPPVALQSRRELLLGGAYPVTGGLSEN